MYCMMPTIVSGMRLAAEANISNGTKGAILFLTKERKSFQVKGPLTYHTTGPIFENMQTWHDPELPGVAATLLRIEEAYSGAEKLYCTQR